MRDHFPLHGKPLLSAVALATAVMVLYASPACAQPEQYRVDQELSFGRFAVTDNFGVYNYVVDAAGNVTADSQFILSSPPATNAEIYLTGLVGSVPFNITMFPGTLSPNGGGGQPLFNVVNFTDDGPYTTSGTGTLTVRFGATLRTSGNMVPYESGPFSGTYDITFDY